MKALVYTRYGPPSVLQLRVVPKPILEADQILVSVRATTVNRTDCATIRAKPFFARVITGLLRPKKRIPGTEFAGDVEAVGINVRSIRVGDRVFGFDDVGAQSHAQYTAVSQDRVTTIPADVTYEQAAASMEGAHYAYNFIKNVKLDKCHRVLVNGATGAIGSAAVQLLRHFGVDVTAVCGAKNVALVRSLGARRVIDYAKVDFTKEDAAYDFVFDMVGKSSFRKCLGIMKPGGVYISSDLGFMAQNLYLPLLAPVLMPILGRRKIVFPTPRDIGATLLLIRKLIAAGEFKAVIDRTYPFENIVEAYEYVEQGHKTGNVVITLDHDISSG